ncbi:MAG: HAMP domain-containing histidine kinase [Bacteroidales bacterium]|nr:HAMP domain-containing histidine kinase [Bacteroidales bacterium]
MSFFEKLFGKKNASSQKKSVYVDTSDFVAENLPEIKKLLSSVGYNDRHKRLADLAQMCGCNVMLLCLKLSSGQDKYVVVESSDRTFQVEDREFNWQHSQPAAASDASIMLMSLPFPKIGATGFISVPIKNSKNLLVGILLGLSISAVTNIDDKTRLLHLMAPTFEPELEVERLKQNKAQYDQRIASLRQNIEVMSNDLKIEKERSAESKELKSIFLTNLSHEIRTPMNVIMGFADLMEQAQTDEERNEFVTIIKQNCDILLKVLDNLIEISKLQSSYMFKAASPVQLNAMLDKIKGKYAGVLDSMGKKIVIDSSYALESPYDTIWNSEEIITKIFEQLLDNACKFTTEGKISFGYTMDHKEATFYVRDTGPGIRPGDEENIFNMFGLVDNTLTRQSSGTGIGLALAKKYIELASGKIWCDVGYKGGACFYFTIPTEKL